MVRYLPAELACDLDRRAAAGVPEHVGFKTKPELAVEMLAGRHDQGQLPDWVTGD